MKRLLFVGFFLMSCSHTKQRQPAQTPAGNGSSYGNFFQPVKVASTSRTRIISKFEEILDRSIYVDHNILDASTKFRVINENNWFIEPVYLSTGSDERFTNYILDMTLGTLSPSQFKDINKMMGAQGVATWDPQKIYSIVDFMPVSVQALYGNYYIHNRYTYDKKTHPWHYKFERGTTVGQISRISNCWHAAWEYLHGAADKVSIFFASEEHIKEIFEDNSRSQVIAKFDNHQLAKMYNSPEVVFRNVNPGDLIMVYQIQHDMREALAHVAIAVDNNIIFEKMNPVSNLPYRLAYLTDSLDNLIMSDKADLDVKTTAEDLAKLRVVVRRFKNKLPAIHNEINMDLKGGGMIIDFSDFKPKDRPSKSFLQTHTLAPEHGTGGTIINEEIYTIQDIQIIKNNGKYILKNDFNYP